MTTKTSIGDKVLFVSVIVFALTLAIPGGGLAKIPEPDNIIYGVAGEDAVTITLEVGGEQIAFYTMGDNPDAGVFFVLRVPMDTMQPYTPGTARSGDDALIFINDETPAAASITLGDRGTIHRLDLDLTDDDNDDILDAWERQIVEADPYDGIEYPHDVLPEHDFDNDGFCNRREWLDGSHPVDTDKIPRCWADVFSDGDVDAIDLAVFVEEYGEYFGHLCPDCTLNMDGDDDIDEWDFRFFREDFGRTDCR